MSESIQSPHPAPLELAHGGCAVADDRRRRWLLDAAELYGRPLAVDVDELDEQDDDRTAVLLAFPWLSDAELIEALWALGVATARPQRDMP